MKNQRWLFLPVVLALASLACQAVTGGATETPQPIPTEPIPTQDSPATEAVGLPTDTPEASSGDSSTTVTTEFPLPADASGMMDLGDGAINFQTEMSLTDVIAFYREAFTEQGLKEREITTAITEATFSLVFDGHESGKAVVLQGVDLGNGTVNVNLRFEDV